MKKISPYEWEIYAYINAWTHKNIVDISYGGEFIEDFRQDISVEDVSGNKIYDIPKYNNDMNIGALQEITEPTNIYDFFPLKEYSGGNKKVTLEGLRKWILKSMHSGSIVRGSQAFSSWGGESASVAVPKGALVTLYIQTDGDYATGTIQTSNDNASWNDATSYQYNDSVRTTASSLTIVVPP